MKKTYNPKTIAVVGSQRRIGTTTQAIQMVEYLQLMGYKACYVEMNSTRFISKAAELYLDLEGKAAGSFKLDNIMMYSSEKIQEILKLDYDFLVKDYGSYENVDFERLSFLEQKQKILVCGAKADEIYQSCEALKDDELGLDGFIFSFVSKEDRDEVKEMMEEKKELTYFADYVPAPFSYLSTANYIYKGLLGV